MRNQGSDGLITTISRTILSWLFLYLNKLLALPVRVDGYSILEKHWSKLKLLMIRFWAKIPLDTFIYNCEMINLEEPGNARSIFGNEIKLVRPKGECILWLQLQLQEKLLNTDRLIKWRLDIDRDCKMHIHKINLEIIYLFIVNSLGDYGKESWRFSGSSAINNSKGKSQNSQINDFMQNVWCTQCSVINYYQKKCSIIGEKPENLWRDCRQCDEIKNYGIHIYMTLKKTIFLSCQFFVILFW